MEKSQVVMQVLAAQRNQALDALAAVQADLHEALEKIKELEAATKPQQ